MDHADGKHRACWEIEAWYDAWAEMRIVGCSELQIWGIDS